MYLYIIIINFEKLMYIFKINDMKDIPRGYKVAFKNK